LIQRRELIGFLGLACLGKGAEYWPDPDSAGGWRTAKPEQQGLSERDLDAAYSVVLGSSKHGGLLVARDGWLVYERYFGRAHREATPNTASCGKAFTSVSLGILMRERPEMFPHKLDEKVFTRRHLPAAAFPLDDPEKEKITLGQLLTMTAGLRGNNPAYVRGKEMTLNPPGPDGWPATVDEAALRVGLWCAPGAGYSYATAGVHIASMILRHITGVELQQYVEEKLAKPLGWGRWGWGYRRPEIRHTPGGGGIALCATDMMRFGYLLLRGGLWRGKQVVPLAYVRDLGRLSPYNPHYPYSLQFEVNGDGHVPGVPKDAYWRTGSGGYALYIVPSLNLVAYKMGGRNDQYSEANTGLPELEPYDGSREDWKQTVDARAAVIQTLQRVVTAA
jgi:CubicO group peptidase (beta-lactamase class C family)